MFSACNAAWPRRPVKSELSIINIRSSTAEAAYQRLAANQTIQMQMRFSGSTVVVPDKMEDTEAKRPIISSEVVSLKAPLWLMPYIHQCRNSRTRHFQ